MEIQYPSIYPVTDNRRRPFFSVMVPVYNGTKYLEQTLNSILEQDLEDEIQIEVIDDCSTEDDPEPLVKRIGKDRISFYRQPHNVGFIANWNTCIQRAYGHWVHMLHQDDIILPGFYRRLRESIATQDTIGAAFCRHIYMDEDGHWQSLSPLERKTPGVVSDLLEHLGVASWIQFASIVVRRNVYEKLGGFCPEAKSAADWEMWKRIAARYPVWYEPQVLACFRLHTGSESSRLVKSGQNISDTRKAIQISQQYLPKEMADKVSSKAREYYADYAIQTAYQMLHVGDLSGMKAQIREALKCSHSFKVIKSTIQLAKGAALYHFWQNIK